MYFNVASGDSQEVARGVKPVARGKYAAGQSR